eukprot:4389003-Amphidinium_carterae.2
MQTARHFLQPLYMQGDNNFIRDAHKHLKRSQKEVLCNVIKRLAEVLGPKTRCSSLLGEVRNGGRNKRAA